MPRARRRCNYPNCRQFQPCKLKGHQRWVNPNSTPLPTDWNKKKRAVRRRDGLSCGMCGRSDRPQECDHRTPRCLGGSDDISNLWFLCKEPCHKQKTREDRMKCLQAKRNPGQ